jgi:hypothetical protein
MKSDGIGNGIPPLRLAEQAPHKAGRLAFFGNHAALADKRAFAAFLAPLRKAEWVVYAKRPFGGPQAKRDRLASTSGPGASCLPRPQPLSPARVE